MTILLGGIEDRLVDKVLALLSREGHAVFVAPNGLELVRLAQLERFDLIIMDLDMPVQDGFKTLERLKSDPKTAFIPVVLTAERNARLTPHLKEFMGFLKQNTIAILDKPVDAEQVEKILARVTELQADSGHCLTDEEFGRLSDGILPEQEAERAHVHLSQCRSCQQGYGEWKRAEELLRGLFRTATTVHMEPSKECLSPWKLTAYFRRSLPKYERARLEEHLSRCSYCTRELVALHRLMKEFDEEEPEPLSEETLERLVHEVQDLVRKSRVSIICIKCLGSIPLESATCPECGAVVHGNAREDVKLAHDDPPDGETSDREKQKKLGKRPRPGIGYLGARKVQVAASLAGLALLTAVALGGFGVYRHQKTKAITKAAFDKMNAMCRTPKESVREVAPGHEITEKLEVFGQVAMFEQKPERFPVPEYVDRTARALIRQYYYDVSIAEQALQRADIHDVFDTLNRLETKQYKSRFLPKFPNRILSPDDVRVLRGDLSGGYEGIGVGFRETPDKSGAEIIGFAAGSSAEEAGLQVGDIITSIDGKQLTRVKLTRISSLLRGPVNTAAELRVARCGAPDFVVSVPRRRTRIRMGAAAVLKHGVGGIGVFTLLEGAVQDVEAALAQFKEHGCQNLILDLRANAGGSLDIAEHVAGLFLPKGAPVSQIEDRDGAHVSRSDCEPLWKGPMVVIVDDKTMSGGELIAAVLKESGRAMVIGETTAGKGSVQTAYRLFDDCGIQITTATLSGPNGQTFNNSGVEPDIRVRGTYTKEPVSRIPNVSEDGCLKAASKAFERS